LLLINIPILFGFLLGNNFKLIGLTGGIATGKSAVSAILAENGFSIIDADKIAKEVMDKD